MMPWNVIPQINIKIFISRHKIPLSVFGLWLIAFGLYAGSLSFGFVNFDDNSVLLAHPNLYDSERFIDSLKAILFDYFPREEPLIVRDISWAIDSKIFGFTNPFGYHLGNVLLNAANVVLLFFLLRLSTCNFRLSFIVALVFALLPIHVEPVCWVMGRKDLLSTFFMLLALIFQSLLLSNPVMRFRSPVYLATIVMTLFALLSKINTVPFFVVLALHRMFWPYLRGEKAVNAGFSFSGMGKNVVPAILPHLVISVLVYLWYRGVLNDWGMFNRGPGPLSLIHLKILALFVPLVLFSYAQLLAYPFQYSIFYPWPSLSLPVHLWQSVPSFIFLAFLLAIGLYFLRNRRDLLFYYLVFFVLMVPYFNIIYIGIWVANRYLYFSLFCIITIIATLGLELYDRGRRMARIAGVSCLIAFLAINTTQSLLLQKVFQNDYSLWSYEVRYLKNPSLLAIQYLARHYVHSGETASSAQKKAFYASKADELIRQGILAFEELDHVQTDYGTNEVFYYAALFVLKGRLEVLREKPASALEYFEKAYAINPGDAQNAFYAAKINKEMALHADEMASISHARKSFDAYAQFVRLQSNDPVWQKQILIGLSDYEKLFPYLKQEIDGVRKNISGVH